MCGEVTGLGRGCQGYEVTVGPAGIGGGRVLCVSGRYGGGGGEFFPPQLDLYVSGMNLGQDTGSGV